MIRDAEFFQRDLSQASFYLNAKSGTLRLCLPEHSLFQESAGLGDLELFQKRSETRPRLKFLEG